MIPLMCGMLYAEVPVRVVQTAGGPYISVNNIPVRPRMFWGTNRGGTVTVTQDWKEFSFDVNTPFTANATWHFRFGQTPGEIRVRNIRITNTATGAVVFPLNSFASQQNFKSSWNVYPPDSKNTVGTIDFADSSLHLTLKNPPAGEPWPDFHLYSNSVSLQRGITYRYTFAMCADKERTVSPQVYHVNNGWTYIGGPPSIFMNEIAMAKNAGVDFITFNVPNCWLQPAKGEDWLPLDAACQQVLDAHPGALIIPRVDMDAPSWWLTEHPGSLMMFEDGTKGTKASISDRTYRQDATAHLEKLAKHLRETFPDRLAGIHPSGQNTGEWFYEKTWEAKLSGYDSATQSAWQHFSGRSVVPSPALRRSASRQMLLDPILDKDVIAFNRFLQEEMSDFLKALAAGARRGLGSDKLVLFFYGYQYEFGPVVNGPATSGHYALEKLLHTPDIDILAAPVSYYDRELSGSGPSMTSVESVLRAGKFWFNEDDTRTYLNTNAADQAAHGGLKTQQETKAVLLRNAAQSALRGYGTWWMDHGAGTPGGWFADPELWKVLDQVKPLDQAMLGRSGYVAPRIALIIDEGSILHIAGGSDVLGRNLLYAMRKYTARTGATYGQYLLTDAIAGAVSSPLKIFLAAWALDAEKRAALIKSRRAHDTRVWCYAPGYCSESGGSLAAMKELTGFEFQKIELPSSVAAPTEQGKLFGITQSWGPSQKVSPLFTVSPESSIVLATYSNGAPALAVRTGAKGTDIFAGTPQLPTEVIRALARYCGVAFSADENVNCWSTENFFAFHTAKDGPLNFSLENHGAPIVDVASGEKLGTNSSVVLNATAGDTRVLGWNAAAGVGRKSSQADEYRLEQNYPNPFNPSTTITYALPAESMVTIEAINMLGQRVQLIVHEREQGGMREAVWNAGSLPSGMYIIRITAAGIHSSSVFTQVKKAMLVR
ncbi:MAG: T9SS type A sorting domain-containing protein [Acidobacteriota bacterium]